MTQLSVSDLQLVFVDGVALLPAVVRRVSRTACHGIHEPATCWN